ncbi:MAG: hypothetical protein GF334_09155 [Candidatus Altiarchaeales archaeon]|nr:hypothetical protein [Candidatus Altiarchaeales archaeon]
MATKQVKDLKKGDKFHAAVYDGETAYAAWVKIEQIDDIRVYSSALPKFTTIKQIHYRPQSGKRRDDLMKAMFYEDQRVRIPNRPNKFMRIWHALWS